MSGNPRARGTIALDPAACTSCMVCARECPDWCLHVASHAEELPPEPGPGGAPARAGRARVVHVLDRFAIDFGLCLFCGICIEVCPFDALAFAPAAAPPGGLTELLAERERLDAARSDVPPPVPLDAGAVPPPPKDSGRGHGGGRRRR